MSEQTKTETPRTDAESKRFNTVDAFDDRDTIPADFARQLERELGEAKASLANVVRERDSMEESFIEKANQLSTALSRVKELESVLAIADEALLRHNNGCFPIDEYPAAKWKRDAHLALRAAMQKEKETK